MSSTIKVNNIQNLAGDDSGIDLSTNDQVIIKTANATALTVDASQNVSFAGDITVLGDDLTIGDNTGDSELHLISATDSSGRINFGDSGDANIGVIQYEHDGNSMVFKTNASERMRVDSSGNFMVGQTTANSDNAGISLRSDGQFLCTRTGLVASFNRLSSDGDLIQFQQASSVEGAISVSGSTVSYGGFSGLHESSGIAKSTAVGTVVSTIDELDTYVSGDKSGQTRADHAKVEVSDTVGDSAVYGVVTRFDDNDKVFVASVGIGSVRVTGACAKGDLLESNGDGTAKVQSDDIVRSKTIGKVTIGNSDTKEKLVSCVLYCG